MCIQIYIYIYVQRPDPPADQYQHKRALSSFAGEPARWTSSRASQPTAWKRGRGPMLSVLNNNIKQYLHSTTTQYSTIS